MAAICPFYFSVVKKLNCQNGSEVQTPCILNCCQYSDIQYAILYCKPFVIKLFYKKKIKTYPFIRYTSQTIYKLRISCQAFYIFLT